MPPEGNALQDALAPLLSTISDWLADTHLLILSGSDSPDCIEAIAGSVTPFPEPFHANIEELFTKVSGPTLCAPDAEGALNGLCLHFSLQALLPVRQQGATVALIGVRAGEHKSDSLDLNRLHIVASAVSVLLSNARDITSAQNYAEQLHQMLSELSGLHEFGRAIESADNPDKLLNYIMKRCMDLMNAESASLMLVDPERNDLEFKVTFGPKASEVQPFRLPIGKGIAGWVAANGEALLIPDAYADSRFNPEFDKQSGYRTRSILCVPMLYKSHTIGVMNILNRLDGHPFTEEDRMLLMAFAAQAALSVENARLLHNALENERLKKELQMASEIQQLLLPAGIPQIGGLDISACYIPCQQVSGDFYDIIQLDENRTVFVVADVSGKGIPGAMLVSNMQASLHAYLDLYDNIIDVVTRLNENMIKQTSADRYITFFIALYDRRDHSVTSVNAGHNRPLLISADGASRELKTGGIFIGYLPFAYESETVTLEPGSTLILYTDGLVEAMNESEEEFGEERLLELARKSHSSSPKNLETEIIKEVHKFGHGQPLEDDFTLMIIKRQFETA